MAHINNQSVIQKLVDELRLYPGKDVIPTELAEKILPVFQVNSDNIIVQNEVARVVKSGIVAGSSSTTFYTTPATGKFFLTNLNLSGSADSSTAGVRRVDIKIVIDGTTVEVASVIIVTTATNLLVNEATSMNFQNPIELDPGSIVTVTGNSASVDAIANIVGYVID